MTDEQRAEKYAVDRIKVALSKESQDITWFEEFSMNYLSGLKEGRRLERERIKKVFCSDINGEETWDFYSKYITPSEGVEK